jgi:hypothetical protein
MSASPAEPSVSAAPPDTAGQPAAPPDPGHPGQPGHPARPALSDRLPRPWLFPLLVLAGTWVLIAVTWRVSTAIYHVSWPWSFYFGYKDAGFFAGIAEHGYPATLHPPPGALRQAGWVAFFPLFPALIRLVMYVTAGSDIMAGLIVVVASGAAASVLIWTLAGRVAGRRAADRAVLLFCLFPGAMALGMLYSDALGVALSAGTLLALLSRRWVLAGTLALLASAEAPTLIVLAAVAGIAALHAIWTRREWRALAAPALAPLGMLGYFAYLGHRYHDYLFWFRIEQQGWNGHVDFGARTARILAWADPTSTQYPAYGVLLIALFAAAVAGLALMIWARLPVPLTLYSALILAAVVASSVPNLKPRLIWAAFGIFIGAGARLPRAVYWPALAVSAAALVFFVGWWPHNPLAPPP